MERLRPPRRRRGLVGKLTGDPSIDAAAAAVLLGVDPGWVLDQPVEDLPIVQAILEAAGKLRTDYDESLAKAIGAETANRILPGLSKQITKLAIALARARH